MPLHPCPTCGSHVLGDVCTCPHCGASVCARDFKLPAAAVLMGLALSACTSPQPMPQPKYGVAFDSSFVDEDGDGYSTDEDCDDANDAVHPGATETSGDGVDSNCDEADDT